jgi:hypothetical protein
MPVFRHRRLLSSAHARVAFHCACPCSDTGDCFPLRMPVDTGDCFPLRMPVFRHRRLLSSAHARRHRLLLSTAHARVQTQAIAFHCACPCSDTGDCFPLRMPVFRHRLLLSTAHARVQTQAIPMCQVLRINVFAWSAQQIPTAVFWVF